jgi:hypothetical protein
LKNGARYRLNGAILKSQMSRNIKINLMKTKILTLALLIITVAGCKKKDNNDDNGGSPSVKAAKSFSNVSFDNSKMFFSTLGTSGTTLDSNQAKAVASTIDITYTWDAGYDAPGFLDPVTRSSDLYYWSDQFQTPFTSVSHQVIWYETSYIDYQDGSFTSALGDQSKITQLLADSSKVSVTTHTIWPAGSCVGGRNSTTGFSEYVIFGFKRVSDGKKGLVEIVSTPIPGLNSTTKVNIAVEN